MKALTTHRLLDCFRKAVQGEESIPENILSSAYDELLDYLLQLQKVNCPFLKSSGTYIIWKWSWTPA